MMYVPGLFDWIGLVIRKGDEAVWSITGNYGFDAVAQAAASQAGGADTPSKVLTDRLLPIAVPFSNLPPVKYPKEKKETQKEAKQFLAMKKQVLKWVTDAAKRAAKWVVDGIKNTLKKAGDLANKAKEAAKHMAKKAAEAAAAVAKRAAEALRRGKELLKKKAAEAAAALRRHHEALKRKAAAAAKAIADKMRRAKNAAIKKAKDMAAWLFRRRRTGRGWR